MAYPALPVKTSTTGPKILTFAGAFALLVTVAVAVLVVRLFLSVVPLGVVAADGAPGPDAVGGTEVPGSVSVELAADTTYVVYLAAPTGSEAELAGDVTVTDPAGAEVPRIPGPASTSTRDGVTAEDVYTFRAGAAGEYTVAAPALADPSASASASIVVAQGHDMPGFFAGLFGTIFGVFLAIGLGMVGLGMTVAGGIWWYVRRSRRRLSPGAPPPREEWQR
ncbi:hypothetical protein LQF12_14675 [Ruania suaedae]|uniref:hypothetical protein n=1 Tax=Ruania suaedae TaxID=2897774 RepID=UPI001E44F388|nr:hypothetical protein [Ruania suaedae]UFU02713.1 hypothetical protein LQF12_14675 [Ruania suaedae]